MASAIVGSASQSCQFSTGLAGDDGRAETVAVLEQLEHIAALLITQRGQAPIVEHKHIGACEAAEQLGVGAVGCGQGSSSKRRGTRLIEGAAAECDSLLSEGAPDIGLAGPGAPVITTFVWSASQLTAAEVAHLRTFDGPHWRALDNLEAGIRQP
jgi:hypothetical protein